jgi:hypothetical protein
MSTRLTFITIIGSLLLAGIVIYAAKVMVSIK